MNQSPLGDDVADFDFRIGLPVAVGAHVVLLALLLHLDTSLLTVLRTYALAIPHTRRDEMRRKNLQTNFRSIRIHLRNEQFAKTITLHIVESHPDTYSFRSG